jgi:anaerobic magnesium-protoporphyrin IX monomethyl ester cyclase
MSKILLIKPRFLNFEFKIISQPLALIYIGATLKKAGHEIKIHDCACDYNDLHILRRTITDWKPDHIGISIIITELEETKRIMGIIREIVPDVPVTFGGPWPSANPEESIKTYGANFVVLGEGEFVFPQLIDAINKDLPADSISGTVSIANGNLKINPCRNLTEDELNSLPFPAWELLDHKLYAKRDSSVLVGRRPYMSIVTSRGCPFKCIYCMKTMAMGKIYRRHSAESVLAQMEELRFRHGFKEFEILDECFNFDRKRMHAILTGIRDRLGDVKLHFPAIRADILEIEDISLFKQAGTVSAHFAIETPIPRLQKMIHKNFNIEKACLIINASVKAGIYSTGFFMMGFPTETYEEASATVEFAARSSLHRALFSFATPFAGTELEEMAIDILKNKSEVKDKNHTNFYYTTNISAMSDDELQRVFRSSHRRFYLNPKRILRIIVRHPNIFSLAYYGALTLIRVIPRRRTST